MTDLAQVSLPGVPDKRQVAASFSRAAASYDSVAALQRTVADALLAQLPADLRPQRWLPCRSMRFLNAAKCRWPVSTPPILPPSAMPPLCGRWRRALRSAASWLAARA